MRRRRQEPGAIHSHHNPPSTAYSNGANPDDAAAVVGIDPWRDVYRYTCPTCGGRAMVAEYTITTAHDPVPKVVRQLICRRSQKRRLPEGVDSCPVKNL